MWGFGWEGSHTQYDIQYHIVWTTKYRYEVLTEKDGEALYDWANSGETPYNYSAVQENIINLATELGGSKDLEVKAATMDILGQANPRNCRDRDLLDKSLATLNALKASRGGSK